MRRMRLKEPSPALIVSVVALVVALGGTSYAAFSLPKNSVGTKQLKNRAVTKPKLANGLATTSNFTQSSPNQNIFGTPVTIGSSIQVTTTGTQRVFGSAAVHAVNGVSGVGHFLVCRILIDGSAGVNDTDYAAPAGGFTIVDAAVSPLASRLVTAGTHTVALQCFSVGGGGFARVVDAALGTWVVGQ